MRRAARVDDNHAEIMAAYRRLFCAVHDTSRLGGGFPDLVVYRGGGAKAVYLVEVKDGKKSPSRRRLTEDEEQFSRVFPVTVVKDVDDVVAHIKRMD